MIVLPGERWISGKLQFMLSQRGNKSTLSITFSSQFKLLSLLKPLGKPLLVHDGYSFGIQYVRKDKKYWQCNLSRKYNCKARVTTTDSGDIIVTNNEHCHTEIRQHLRKDYKMNKLHNQLHNQLNSHYMNFGGERKINLPYMSLPISTSTLTSAAPSIPTTTTSIMPRQIADKSMNSFPKNLSMNRSRSHSPSISNSPPPSKCSPTAQQQFWENTQSRY